MSGANAVARLSHAIQFKTVSNPDYSAVDFGAFDGYLMFLREAFPLFFATCETESVNEYALLCRWRGKSAEAPPVLFLAHYDVVPADENGWKYPPFSGEIADGYITGRGTLDIKSQMIAHFEAVEALVQQGFQPNRDIWFAYGHDEEVGTGHGADKIVEVLKQCGLRFAGVLDEGGIVVSGALKGVTSPVALIGIAEKGRADFEITVKGSGGHASMPPSTTALGQVAEIVRRIENNPLPARITPPLAAMLSAVSVEMGAAAGFAARHLTLCGGLVKNMLAKTPETNAMIRTTFAATMAKASDASNVLPTSATVNINTRLLPGDSLDYVEEHLKKLIGDIPAKIRRVTQTEASEVSPVTGEFCQKLINTVKRLFPEAIAAPYLVCGGTDGRKYSVVAEGIYRFTPLLVTNEEKNAMHNANERISIAGYERMIEFFSDFFKQF
jgi:carboxypeptidase PM20D1